ncbi:helix-turn-helix transcriptional regulator [Streptomyces sp. A1136]|uniref:telomere-associated protein Tap n=1 Tax=Streptomyces sp. A1136 TaxID=2563102 RepID=UPI00109E84E7|nr:helix-turn-helix domain-containing protein [Streptomyces sp. A1136]THA54628.1 helix-turn-helix domain-containing protein [Streptomyces sp. A1136]
MSQDPEQTTLFAAVDALLEEAAAQDGLPHPDERKRLREAAGLSQDQIAKALSVRRETVTSWETGRTAPRPPKRAAYARLLEGLSALHPAPGTPAPAPAPGTLPDTPSSPAAPAEAGTAEATATIPAPQPQPQPHPPTASHPPAPAPPSPVRHSRAPHSPAPRTTPPRTTTPHTAPLAVLTGTTHAHIGGGVLLDLPPKAATHLPTLIAWALGPDANLRSPRLHRNGKDGDPLLVLTAAATEALGLPLVLEDRRALRLPDTHPALKLLAQHKWQLTRRGFGPWARVYRPATPTTGRQCVQLAILPWGALDSRAWGEDTADLPAPELAELLTTYATRVLTPRGSTAVTGLELMTALRPPTRAARNPVTGAWESAPVPGSLTRPVDPAPPEAPDEHPVVAALYPRAHQRTPDQVLDEEAYDWFRDPQLLTDDECARTHAVGIDVNMAFAAAANRLVVGLGPATHTTAPRFDPKTPGCWLADLSSLPHDPRLPSPFTPHGRPPTGPAWYATPTLAYAQELGHAVHPTEAWLRPESGAYLDAWYTRLRDAYMATMADLGITPALTESEFLEAMTTYKQHDPIAGSVLSAIKSTVKGGIGKLRERPQGAGYRPGEAWAALERPTWRPDIRAAVISTARVNMHRKMRKLATAAGEYPIAVLSDCAVYLSPGPGPLDFLPRTPEGKPLPGGFRIGVSPGMVKHEGTQPLLWAVEMLDSQLNPARHIKGHDAAADGE